MLEERLERMGSSERVRVGLAGLGRFGKLHAAVLGEMADVELAAFCDPQPDEVAAMVRFIIAEASFSTGTEFVIDGGATILPPW